MRLLRFTWLCRRALHLHHANLAHHHRASRLSWRVRVRRRVLVLIRVHAVVHVALPAAVARRSSILHRWRPRRRLANHLLLHRTANHLRRQPVRRDRRRTSDGCHAVQTRRRADLVVLWSGTGEHAVVWVHVRAWMLGVARTRHGHESRRASRVAHHVLRRWRRWLMVLD